MGASHLSVHICSNMWDLRCGWSPSVLNLATRCVGPHALYILIRLLHDELYIPHTLGRQALGGAFHTHLDARRPAVHSTHNWTRGVRLCVGCVWDACGVLMVSVLIHSCSTFHTHLDARRPAVHSTHTWTRGVRLCIPHTIGREASGCVRDACGMRVGC